MATAQQIIDSALRLDGILASGEISSAAEAADGLQSLNDLLDTWNAERLMIFSVVPQTFPLVVGQQSYTMGTGGNFNVPRPARIERASTLSFSNSVQPLELEIPILTDAEWQAIPVKNIPSSLPLAVWDDGGFPLRTLSYWGIPTVPTLSTILYVWTALTQFANLSTNYTFPPAYARAIRFNLAVDLAPEYGRQVDPVVARVAMESLARIKSINAPLTYLTIDPALRGVSGHYNYYSDTVQ